MNDSSHFTLGLSSPHLPRASERIKIKNSFNGAENAIVLNNNGSITEIENKNQSESIKSHHTNSSAIETNQLDNSIVNISENNQVGHSNTSLIESNEQTNKLSK